MQGTFLIELYPVIRVVDAQFEESLGVPAGKDSLTAYFRVKVTWCDADIDFHVAQNNPENLTRDIISVEAWSRLDIVPGLYQRLDPQGKIFERIQAA